MENMARDFVLSDFKRKLAATDDRGAAAAPVPDKPDDRAWIEQLNQWLQNAEQESIAREAVTPVNPHIHIAKGSALKRLLKRFIRKMIYWLLQPVVVQQSGYNTLNNDVTNQLRDSITWANFPDQPWPYWQVDMKTQWLINSPQPVSGVEDL